jgi:hypothetical protein
MPPSYLITMYWSLHCAIWGHDDRMRRAPDRLFLECVECGRATAGWTIGSPRFSRRADDREATLFARLRAATSALFAGLGS